MRAVSIMTGYYIQPTGPNSCTFIYLSQADPKGKTMIDPSVDLYLRTERTEKLKFISFLSGSLPKVVVNKATQFLAPRVRTFFLFFFFLVKEAETNHGEHTLTRCISVRVCVHEVNV